MCMQTLSTRNYSAFINIMCPIFVHSSKLTRTSVRLYYLLFFPGLLEWKEPLSEERDSSMVGGHVGEDGLPR